jgi:hypothetical protein
MSDFKSNSRNIVLLMIVLLVTVLRTVAPFSDNFSMLANFSAVGAITLFSGAYFKDQIKSLGIPLVTLLATDLILSLTIYKEYSNGFLYDGWYWTYLAFAMMVLASRLIVKKINFASFLGGTIAMVLIHWVVTDIPVWYGSKIYPQNLFGFWQVLVLAIPFELRFLYGTLIYGALMFGAYEFIRIKFPSLSLQKN